MAIKRRQPRGRRSRLTLVRLPARGKPAIDRDNGAVTDFISLWAGQQSRVRAHAGGRTRRHIGGRDTNHRSRSAVARSGCRAGFARTRAAKRRGPVRACLRRRGLLRQRCVRAWRASDGNRSRRYRDRRRLCAFLISSARVAAHSFQVNRPCSLSDTASANASASHGSRNTGSSPLRGMLDTDCVARSVAGSMLMLILSCLHACGAYLSPSRLRGSVGRGPAARNACASVEHSPPGRFGCLLRG